MIRDLRERWLTALRSGKYAKTWGALRSDSGTTFCALGVLCDVAYPEEWEFISALGRWNNRRALDAYSLAGLSLDDRVLVATWNDAPNFDFPAIADALEEKWA